MGDDTYKRKETFFGRKKFFVSICDMLGDGSKSRKVMWLKFWGKKKEKRSRNENVQNIIVS